MAASSPEGGGSRLSVARPAEPRSWPAMPLALPAHDAFQRIEVTPGLLGAILLQLDPEDFARAGATCPRWRVVVAASNESAVWAAACAPFPLIGLIRAQRIAATQAAKPASGPQVADSWRDLYIQRVLANKRIETAATTVGTKGMKVKKTRDLLWTQCRSCCTSASGPRRAP